MELEADTEEVSALVVQTEQYRLEPETQQSLLQLFTPMFTRAEEWKKRAESIVVTDASQVREMKMAREARLALRDIRIEVEHERKRLKEDSLRKGKAIDGIANVVKYLIEPIEKHLEEQEKFVEVQEEKRRVVRLQERTAKMSSFGIDLTAYDLKNMSDESFDRLYEGTRLAIEQRIAQEKAQAEERERVRVENERLRKEAEDRQKAIEEERRRVEEERRKEREEQERVLAEQKRIAELEQRKQREEQARILAEANKKAELERKAIEEKARKEREIAEAKARKERAERERIEAEMKAKKAAEAKAVREAEAAKKKASRAPDRKKLFTLAAMIVDLELPEMSTEEGAAILSQVKELIGRLTQFIEQKASDL